jgi:hypothetical protein
MEYFPAIVEHQSPMANKSNLEVTAGCFDGISLKLLFGYGRRGH